MLTLDKIQRLLRNWEIEATIEIDAVFKRGTEEKAENAWFLGNEYVFKTGRNIEKLKNHICIARSLENQGLKATTPVKTIDGKDFIIQDDQFFILMNKVEGDFLKPLERFENNRIEIGKKYGEAIARMHSALLMMDEDTDIIDRNMVKVVKEWALPKTRKVLDKWNSQLPDEFYDNYLENCDVIFTDLPKQVIHRDPSPANIMFREGEVSGFIDFEDTEKNFRILDPCYCATGMLMDAANIEKGYDKWPELLSGIINGYNNINKLSKKEIDSIPYVIYSTQMILLAWLEGRDDFEEVARANREMTLWLWNNQDMWFSALNL